VGTIARVVVGAVFLAPAFDGALASSEWLLGLVGYPTLLLVWQWIRSRRDPTPINATGPVGFALNLAGFLALYLTPIYLPALAITSDSALIFYGNSMLLAAARGYRGCELLAVSNWLLRRPDRMCGLLPGRSPGKTAPPWRVIDPEVLSNVLRSGLIGKRARGWAGRKGWVWAPSGPSSEARPRTSPRS
jgi:hypothetical protein